MKKLYDCGDVHIIYIKDWKNIFESYRDACHILTWSEKEIKNKTNSQQRQKKCNLLNKKEEKDASSGLQKNHLKINWKKKNR